MTEAASNLSSRVSRVSEANGGQPVLAVLHKLSDSLTLFDVTMGADLFTLATNRFPHELCASADRRKLYLSEYGLRGVETSGEGGNTVGVYDLKRRERTATIELGAYRRPHGIATHASGKLFVTSEPDGFLLILDAVSGELLHAVQTDQRLPHIAAVAPDGRTAYVANLLSNTLTAVDAESGKVIARISVLARPEGMAFSSGGELLYAANRESRAIAIVDTREQRMIGKIKAGGWARGRARFRALWPTSLADVRFSFHTRARSSK